MSDRARSIEEIIALFESPAMSGTYGEDVSIREHMLQCAAHAKQQGLAPTLIAAALLHDIGWALGGEHETSGATYVRTVLGNAVADPIALHVKAKRYLVATRPDYAAILSDMSVHTLQFQGGAMSKNDCAIFEREPFHNDAIKLRLLDDTAKDTGQTSVGIRNYVPLLTQVADKIDPASI